MRPLGHAGSSHVTTMRLTPLLAALALTTLAVAAPASAMPAPGPDPVSFGSPCLNGGTTLIVYGQTVLQCWKPVDSPVARCMSEVCEAINVVCQKAFRVDCVA